MTMFNSQKINNDPFPWDWIGNTTGESGGRCAADVPEDCRHAYHGVFDPRPEFDNSPNPILVDFRRSLGIQERGSVAAHARWWLRLRDIEPDMTAECWSDPPIAFTDEHYAHAWKVLERLAAL
ncbi:hypothetical protein MUN77_01730 [Leucobacter allii]|uniref:hypothetical protein n=1 Tax=Leucobacter allii TaxID=2932247 RepID=UPI001FD3E31B|nr:hypothetical protein [Leucobacter allii]UOR02080.1 hypothetical protein MUN77_01730 [Leucobacter allii]